MAEIEKKTGHTLDDFIHPQSKNKLRHRAGIAAGVLLLLVGAWFAITKSGLDAVIVKRQLDQLAVQLREDGKKDGRLIDLSYGEVEIVGAALGRHAVVHEVKLLLKPETGPVGTPEKPNSLLITSPAVEMRTSGGKALALSFPQPLNVASEEAPNKSMLQISANAPITLSMSQQNEGGVPFAETYQSWPQEVRVTYLKEQQAAGAEDETPTVVPIYQTLVITSNKAEARLRMAQDQSGMGDGMIALDNLTIMPEGMPEGAIKAGEVRGLWKNMLDAEKVKLVEGHFTVDAITAAPEIISYAPISIAFDATQRGTMPKPGQPTATPASYQLKTFSLKTKEASVDATADFASAAGDMLPVGKANLNVVNLPFVIAELKRLRLLGEENDVLLNAIVERVAGQPYAEVKNLNVAINRPQGGAFTIGKSTFEELFTLVLATKLQALTDGQADVIAPPQQRMVPAPETITEDYGAKG